MEIDKPKGQSEEQIHTYGDDEYFDIQATRQKASEFDEVDFLEITD